MEKASSDATDNPAQPSEDPNNAVVTDNNAVVADSTPVTFPVDHGEDDADGPSLVKQLKDVLHRSYLSISKKKRNNEDVDPDVETLYVALKITSEILGYQMKNAGKAEMCTVWRPRRDMTTFETVHSKSAVSKSSVSSTDNANKGAAVPAVKVEKGVSKAAMKKPAATKNKATKNGNNSGTAKSGKGTGSTKKAKIAASNKSPLNQTKGSTNAPSEGAASPTRVPRSTNKNSGGRTAAASRKRPRTTDDDQDTSAMGPSLSELHGLKAQYPNIPFYFHARPDKYQENYNKMMEDGVDLSEEELNYIVAKFG